MCQTLDVYVMTVSIDIVIRGFSRKKVRIFRKNRKKHSFFYTNIIQIFRELFSKVGEKGNLIEGDCTRHGLPNLSMYHPFHLYQYRNS